MPFQKLYSYIDQEAVINRIFFNLTDPLEDLQGPWLDNNCSYNFRHTTVPFMQKCEKHLIMGVILDYFAPWGGAQWSVLHKNAQNQKVVEFSKHLIKKLSSLTLARGRFHKSWAHGTNHRDSSIKVGRTAQTTLYNSKKLLKSWA